MGQSLDRMQGIAADRAGLMVKVHQMTWDRLTQQIADINVLCLAYASRAGLQHSVQFDVGKTHEEAMHEYSKLWRSFLRIRCRRVATDTMQAEDVKLLSLKTFCRLAQIIEQQCAENVGRRSSSPRQPHGIDALHTRADASHTSPQSLNADAFFVVISLDTPEGRDWSCSVCAKEDFCDRSHPSSFVTKNTLYPLCDRPSMVAASLDPSEFVPVDDLDDCIVCFETRVDEVMPCAHAYCHSCVEKLMIWTRTCPLCRTPLVEADGFQLVDGPTDLELGSFILDAAEAI
ncbi:hypothetical protein CAOG_02356 [Capsaspora owczarzaki ATCC 30864]|uniref:RING-type domain-containing protein n=1 Tax=Capsaspora owczarzaki (strain ATCC 30864) TaxID=595528 RepID=A0A0D2WM72_CAPO3|nr:hypothetical protein CAOG_02356 [Capsaspora owczarzaki ATCC 30864]KJE91188.1 hypothetical protein, variant 3 [Capsaspora owczarzaki ATCC 30864]|eukprot:XP_004349106.2 hypothetical protein CAOG_02356 [Capsaspora owczarzaki ATCC 30864]